MFSVIQPKGFAQYYIVLIIFPWARPRVYVFTTKAAHALSTNGVKALDHFEQPRKNQRDLRQAAEESGEKTD